MLNFNFLKRISLGVVLLVSLGFASTSSAQSQRLEGNLTITPNSVTTADDITFTWNTNAPEGSVVFIQYVPTVWNAVMNIGYPAAPLAPSGSITLPASKLTQYYLWYYPGITSFDFTATLVAVEYSRKRASFQTLDSEKFYVKVVPQ